MGKQATPPRALVATPSTPLHSAPRLIPLLEGTSNFDEWKETLWDTFEQKGLQRFIDGALLFPPIPVEGSKEYDVWDRDRQLAKAILKQSVGLLTEQLLAMGWRPKHKDPLHHYGAVLGLIMKSAESSGLTGRLVEQLCKIDRGDFMSLASYKGRLQTLRQRLTNLGYDMDDRFYLHVAINGLQSTNRRWATLLQQQMSDGSLTWHELMQAMYGKAIRERGDAIF
ncbi:uncharacterized protein E0L32_003789 [Thyridium curvatum]|uniref:DUF4219 domain-containing protein n=1 Tax=Thyridium curvatum TaxID=1093900 RepID=A0A507B076_9PEZI|nr:uncharacterized protein E0L32_003789 [Thyridium curvatum]TPX16495.1 hypothetical protein E0L32_003789 [Thyridium curvatum]